jgi:hypothetical protein
MGGNALSVETNRLDDRTFRWAQRCVRDRILDAFPDAKYHFVRAIREKADHGDMDVLIRQDTVDRATLRDEFSPTELFSNGRVDSLDYQPEDVPRFQLDLVYMRPEWWDVARAFHDWNDLGNLVGKVARFRRMKYGFQGLRIPVYHTMDRSQKLGEYTLSRCPATIYRALGYDPRVPMVEGFDTFEEMFEFVMSSEYATYDVFQPEALTASQRHLDTKRGVYKMFMDWLDVKRNQVSPGKTTPRFTECQRRPSHRSALESAKKVFPDANLKDSIAAKREALKRSETASAVFNGRHALERFDIEGRELGRVLGHMKSYYGDGWDEHVLSRGRSRMIDEFRIAMLKLRKEDA